MYIWNKGNTSWFLPTNNCQATAIYIYKSTDDQSGYEDMFSSILMAVATGKKIKFLGECSDDGQYLIADYLQIIS